MDHITSQELQVSSIEQPVTEHHLTNTGRSGLNRLNTNDYRLTTNWSKFSTNLDLFMQNKANFQKVKFYVNKEMTRTYAKWTLGLAGKTKPNKANSKPIKANLKKSQNERNCFYNKGIRKMSTWVIYPKQSQTKPISHQRTTNPEPRTNDKQIQFQRQKNAAKNEPYGPILRLTG
jgi:hypothetical protein